MEESVDFLACAGFCFFLAVGYGNAQNVLLLYVHKSENVHGLQQVTQDCITEIIETEREKILPSALGVARFN